MTTARMLILAALAMSLGWGIRGDYGHESGAILPGALLGLAIVMASGRADWQQRSTAIALLCGLGWAIGGQMSYGLVIGYSAHDTWVNVAYGYACLFAIGALWGGIGAAALTVSLTWPRSHLAGFAWPLVAIGVVWFGLDLSGWTDRLNAPDTSPISERWAMFDVDWIAAASALAVSLLLVPVPRFRRAALVIAVMSLGWLLGFVGLVDLAGLRMTPPRSDNWAGCVGMLLALLVWLAATRQWAAIFMVSVGMLAGGFGFAIGDFWHMLGRGEWGPLGEWQPLKVQNYWKWMEQFFGLLMGLGVAWGAVYLLRAPLEDARNDEPRGTLDTVGLIFLLVVMPWLTLGQNVDTWREEGWLVDQPFGVDVRWWILSVGILLAAIPILAAFKLQRGTLPLAPASHLGRAQWLFLLLMWICVVGDLTRALPFFAREGVFSVHLTFWYTACIASLLALSINDRPPAKTAESIAAHDRYWLPTWRHLLFWLAVPVAIAGVTAITLATHEGPRGGARERFEPAPIEAEPEVPVEP